MSVMKKLSTILNSTGLITLYTKFQSPSSLKVEKKTHLSVTLLIIKKQFTWVPNIFITLTACHQTFMDM